jgi:ubiquinone/menaquinone biosynthesis C-methylase UbiE
MPSDSVDPLAAVAPFYDLDLDGYDDDITMYREFASERGTEVLELGCGTGRVVEPLARDGCDVTAVDLSPAMLERAQQRTAGLSGDGSVALIEGDMRILDVGRQFDCVFVPLGGLQHMEEAADVAATLATVARHLKPDGLAVVDIEAAHPDDLTPGPQPLLQHWSRANGTAVVTKLVAVDGEPSALLKHVTWHFDVQPADGPLQRVTAEFPLRVITAGELELAARLAGLTVTEWHGGYDGVPVDDGDDRLVALLEHAE